MAERSLLDTDVLIEYLRGRPKAIEYLEGLSSDLYISVISIAELFAGVKGDEEERSLKQFLLAFAVLPVTEKVARLAGLYRRDYGPPRHRLGGRRDCCNYRRKRCRPCDLQPAPLSYGFRGYGAV